MSSQLTGTTPSSTPALRRTMISLIGRDFVWHLRRSSFGASAAGSASTARRWRRWRQQFLRPRNLIGGRRCFWEFLFTHAQATHRRDQGQGNNVGQHHGDWETTTISKLIVLAGPTVGSTTQHAASRTFHVWRHCAEANKAGPFLLPPRTLIASGSAIVRRDFVTAQPDREG